MQRTYPKGSKRVADSLTASTFILQHKDINGENRLFGGRLMEWIDTTAGIAARRHCGASITTACVDSLVFRHPAYLNDVVYVCARLTHVGRTSMEVRVDVYVEDCATGERNAINTAYLTEVCVDAHGTPQPVEFGLELVSDEERREWEDAEKRIAIRKQRDAEGF
ncbi:MAG: acyl-CoA thioesterase [Olsenella sp.]|nr:acyl-CoA thioesterase [Olsenella sp.]